MNASVHNYCKVVLRTKSSKNFSSAHIPNHSIRGRLSKIPRQFVRVKIDERAKTVMKPATSRSLAIARDRLQQGLPVFNFGQGESPFDPPHFVVDAMRNYADRSRYPFPPGIMQLREAIASFYSNIFGLHIKPANVLIGPGGRPVIDLLFRCLDHVFIIPTPSWVSYQGILNFIGRKFYFLHTLSGNDFRLKPMDLDKFLKDYMSNHRVPPVVVLTIPENPQGGTYQPSELEEFTKIARRYEVVLVTDEMYSLLHHEGERNTMMNYYPEGSIIIDGASKALSAPGWRISFAIISDRIAEVKKDKITRLTEKAIEDIPGHVWGGTNVPAQHALVEAYNQHARLIAHLTKEQRILAAAAKAVGQRLSQEIFPGDEKFHAPSVQAGLYSFVRLPKGVMDRLSEKGFTTTDKIAQGILRDTGVLLIGGEHFGRSTTEGTFRLTYAAEIDGKKSIQAIGTMPSEGPLPDTFTEQTSPRLIQGVDLFIDWIKRKSS